jgi:hypothetical protein
MTPAAAARAIEAAVLTAWGTTTPIAWPNVPFTPPTTSTAKWLKVDFVWGSGAVATKGLTGGLNRVTAFLQLTVFGPKGQGDGTLYTLAETARALFNRRRLATPYRDICFGATSGPTPIFDESWRALVITAPFQVEDVIS